MSISDEAARQQAIDPTRSFCVSAPAGSGKTELLTQRLLGLLARVERPEQVLAITFTRKAAGEMVARILEKISEAEAETPVSEPHEQVTRELAKGVLAHAREIGWRLDETTLNVRTIDSFCHELTRQMPILSGTGGLVEPADDPAPLYENAASQLLLRGAESNELGAAIRDLLAHFDNRWARVRDLLTALLVRRGDWGPYVGQHHDPAKAKQALLDTVTDLIEARLEVLCRECAQVLPELEAAMNEAQAVLKGPAVSLSSNLSCLAGWQLAGAVLLTAADEWRKPGGVNIKLGFEKGSAAKQQMANVLQVLEGNTVVQSLLIEMRVLPAPEEGGEGWELLVTLSSLLPLLQAHLLLEFQRSGEVDHTHVALAAIDALGADESPTSLAQRLDYQLEHILVDEFQDTSVPQAEFLRRLTRGWYEHNETGAPPRTLFIVGDAMQSIYGFRYADVGLFLGIRNTGMGGLQLKPLTLTRNFRSRPSVVRWANRVFSQMMGVSEDVSRGRVTHVASDSVRAAARGVADDGVTLRLYDRADASAEARGIIEEIQAVRDSAPGASIGILVRARSHADPIIAALVAHDLPYSGEALLSLSEQPIVRDLMALCRWLANPADNVAALAILRSPWVGLSLSGINSLLKAEQARPFSLLKLGLADDVEGLSVEDASRLRECQAALSWAVARRDRLALPVWIEQTWLRLMGPATANRADLDNMGAVLQSLRRAEAARLGLDPDWLIKDLNRQSAENEDDETHIRVTTIHKAKGLEFDYVFMPGLQKKARANQRDLLRWHWHEGDRGRGLLIAAEDRDKTSKTLYNYLNILEKEKANEEVKRLLYVGVTRAREQVSLSASVALDGDGPIKAPEGSFLALLMAGGAEVGHGSLAKGDALRTKSPNLAAMRPPLSRRKYVDVPISAGASGVGSSPTWVGTDISARSSGLAPATNRLDRVLGTVTHRILERLTALESLPDGVDSTVSRWIAANALSANLSPSDDAAIQMRCTALIENTLSCHIGRWLLARHPDAHSEMAITRVESDEAKTYVIDRTFADEDAGIRWVIDFKTSEPRGEETVEAFTKRERDSYQRQLLTYVELLSLYPWEHRLPIKAALYFPAIQQLVPLEA